MATQRKPNDDDPARTNSGSVSEESEKFEDQLEHLEGIVTRIDSGELSLEESIEAFERGVKLVRSLNHKLDEVERRVEVLMRGAGSNLIATPYDGETGVEESGGSAKGNGEDDDSYQ